jgi:methenyltetrahydrofolate cyclohydrolase
LKLCQGMVEKGNPAALSDGGVGGLMAAAAVQGALFNVEINLASIKDEEFVKAMRQKIREMELEMGMVRERVISTVKEKLQP